ncbi:(2Fe-2S)-binding protein [Gluconacetobacter liquefaciens]|uniref:(2Fe-2S)-binding protein n=1 Tax=Gluconacetobacter liquefaciens TaxID=89584 RepID=A0A370FYW7_GLULI|nr:(2Fe-2S)-binding protein [Gluconacetobacter liquefaciens]MBB2187282.1 (2Fe-2S)-binding protein [Gluconacetobacter liquefaciens]RDI36827.1 2Fe-2S iron-sulfur cluster protein [Gluconacetobacter liquefaciens]GBQ93867.1 hypothetical protein AA0522_0290 [Gluconacetobacter liquefaciens NRIC 0522]GEB38848.1 (2Fe-2S)-binding protein [Gluconacetobacter liquefaciens]
MFRLLEQGRSGEDAVTIDLDGQPVRARAGETVASVLMREAEAWCRATPVSQARRAPYCMMGVCFDCLMLVEGEGLLRACQTYVRDGMKIRRQIGARHVVPSC